MSNQWIRKIGLILETGGQLINVSAFHIKFNIQQSDVETPNTATIRVYNLSDETVNRLTSAGSNGEYTGVNLNAGYENGNYGAIFQGTVKQWRKGRENSTTTYLDILAADGDIAYNQGITYGAYAAGTVTPLQLAQHAADGMQGNDGKPIETSFTFQTDAAHQVNVRGTVLYGMSKWALRNIATSLDASWSIQNGVVTMGSNTAYEPGEAVEINVATGLVGTPEQTGEGIRIQCLLNSRIKIGGLVKINNGDVNQLISAGHNVANVAYNSRSNLQPNASLAADGVYTVFVAEHEGDNRGHPWYTHLTCLAVNLSNPTEPVSPN